MNSCPRPGGGHATRLPSERTECGATGWLRGPRREGYNHSWRFA